MPSIVYGSGRLRDVQVSPDDLDGYYVPSEYDTEGLLTFREALCVKLLECGFTPEAVYILIRLPKRIIHRLNRLRGN